MLAYARPGTEAKPSVGIGLYFLTSVPSFRVEFVWILEVLLIVVTGEEFYLEAGALHDGDIVNTGILDYLP